ncbi:hypothetical protein [Rhodococcus erythropolis]|uniref:hypothetical protein n=1 Tax=Rhodococcus erythropolis TaxID=1833 RepID=UPI001BED2C0E|nr:hypothetical protein [Rhodococcus erythropolis]MBT2266453.1 hypothetical protein [Rhodococcus erythropolis]
MKVADILEDSPGAYVPYRDDQGVAREAWITSWVEVGGPNDNPDPDHLDRGRWTLTVELGIASNV